MSQPGVNTTQNIVPSQIDTPSLNIFLGSTPTFAALEVMSQLQYLSQADRNRVALVFIDIDNPFELMRFREEHRGLFQEFNLRIGVLSGGLYADPLPPGIAAHTYLANKTPESFDVGAGGIRNNGHVAACTRRDDIEHTLNQAIMALTRLQRQPVSRPVNDVQVNIVAFLGGGTGSGILPDIAVMARQLILGLGFGHRLNLFCLLPEEVTDANADQINWRKSNATATLLELIALSLVRGDNSSPYVKYMQKQAYQMRGGSIADEVFLFGRTFTGQAKQAAQIIGLELYNRIINASGVGFREHSQAVDRLVLATQDNMGLPNMFGTTCPLEVVFPTHETAAAFAKLTAARLLPRLVARMDTTRTAPTPPELDRAKEWDRALMDVGEPAHFRESEFDTAGEDQLERLMARFTRQVAEAEEVIRASAAARERQEQQAIQGPALEEMETKMQRALSYQRIFGVALERVQSIRPPLKARPDRSIQRDLLRNFHLLPGGHQRAVLNVTEDFNTKQKQSLDATRLEERKQLLIRLLDYVGRQINDLRKIVSIVDPVQTAIGLERDARNTLAWRGLLESSHIHRRHVFDLYQPGLAGMNSREGSPPVERLYALLTPSKPVEMQIQEFTEWLQRLHRDDAGILAVNPKLLCDKLVEYLETEIYLPALLSKNLFDMLALCCVERGENPTEKVGMILLGHLNEIGRLARQLVAFEEALQSERANNVATSLYLGINWASGDQQTLIQRICDRIEGMAGEGIRPVIDHLNDPHRLQLVYGKHGISIRTMTQYYLENSSSMGEFQRYQQAWFGDGKKDGTYGQNKQPVFSSGEMEELVMSKTALRDAQKRNLPERIIRRPQQGNTSGPSWPQMNAAPGAFPGNNAPGNNGRAGAQGARAGEDLGSN